MGYADIQFGYEEIWSSYYFDKDSDISNMFIMTDTILPDTTTILTELPVINKLTDLYPQNSIIFKGTGEPNLDQYGPFYRTNTTWNTISISSSSGGATYSGYVRSNANTDDE
jgi:hypothetical protein